MNDNYLEHIRNEIITTETKVLVREYNNNLEKLTRNYNIGKELTLAGKHYGEGIVKKYANIMTKEFGTTYGFTNLNYMRQFYNFIEKFHALHGNLTWNHYLKLLPLNDINEVNYYIHITMRDNLSYRNLSLRIKNDEYHRLPPETRDKLETNKRVKSGEEVLNPIIVRTNNLKEKFHPVDGKLTWYHYKLLLPFKDINKKRELSLKIKSDEYHRLPIETRDKLETNKKNKVRRRST